MHQEVVAMSFRVTRCGHGVVGLLAWPGPHQQQRQGTGSLSLAQQAFLKQLGLAAQQGKNSDSLGSRLPHPTASSESSTSSPVPGEPIPHPHPSWLAEEERQPRGSPYEGVGLGSYSVWTKGSPSARSAPQTVGRQPAAVLWALKSSCKL